MALEQLRLHTPSPIPERRPGSAVIAVSDADFLDGFHHKPGAAVWPAFRVVFVRRRILRPKCELQGPSMSAPTPYKLRIGGSPLETGSRKQSRRRSRYRASGYPLSAAILAEPFPFSSGVRYCGYSAQMATRRTLSAGVGPGNAFRIAASCAVTVSVLKVGMTQA